VMPCLCPLLSFAAARNSPLSRAQRMTSAELNMMLFVAQGRSHRAATPPPFAAKSLLRANAPQRREVVRAAARRSVVRIAAAAVRAAPGRTRHVGHRVKSLLASGADHRCRCG
ncbi:hypothetical protein Dimus_032317, partial [Dionaea muscipula]